VTGRLWCRLGALVIAALTVGAAVVAAQDGQRQDGQRQNIFRYVLDVEPPEPTGFVPLDLGTRRVYRATGPKPVAAAVLASAATGDSVSLAANLEFSPYYLLGGGTRTLESYRANSVAGRLRRIVTKTLIGVAVAHDPSLPGATRLSLALRATFHDPHDPIPPVGGLVERVREALARGESDPADEEDVGDAGVDLRPLYRASRREMRARCCLQIAGGWGLAGRLGGAAFAGDSLAGVRHTLFVTTQYTFARRFDLLTTVQAWNGFDEDTQLRVGAAIMRKTTAVDLTAEIYFDSADDRLHPGAWIEGQLLPRMRAAASFTTETDAAGGPTKLRVRTLLRWYMAQVSS